MKYENLKDKYEGKTFKNYNDIGFVLKDFEIQGYYINKFFTDKTDRFLKEKKKCEIIGIYVDKVDTKTKYVDIIFITNLD